MSGKNLDFIRSIHNKIFTFIKKSSELKSEEDLLGTWNCRAYQREDLITGAGWTLVKNLYKEHIGISLTFTDDGDGTYALSTPDTHPLNSCDDCSVSVQGDYAIVENTLFTRLPGTHNPTIISPYVYSLQMISETEFKLTLLEAAPTQAVLSLVCDKQNLLPKHPTQLSATSSGFSINLSAEHVNENETHISRN